MSAVSSNHSKMPNQLTRRKFLKLCGASSAGLVLAACGVAPTSTPAPANTPAPTSSATPKVTLAATPQPTIALQGLQGVTYPDEILVQQGLEKFSQTTQVRAEGLVYEIRSNLNEPSKSSIVFARNPNTKTVILSTRFDPGTKEYKWRIAGLRDLGDALGFKLGTTMNGADPWNSPQYGDRVSEFNTIAPIGANVEDVIFRLQAPRWNDFVQRFSREGAAVRIYNLFWHQDHLKDGKPILSDPLWNGAPSLGQSASPEYKKNIADAIDAKIKTLLTTVPWLNELGFANEAFRELPNGTTTWADSPYRRAFGDDWLIEACVRTHKVATQLGRTVGKDLTIFYSDFNYELPNRKADFVFDQLSRAKTEVIKRLTIEGYSVSQEPFVVDMQFHGDFNSPPMDGQFYARDLQYENLKTNLLRFRKIGPVWIGEWTIRGGTRSERTEFVRMVIKACLDSKAVDNVLFWSLMNPNPAIPYAKGDLLFDANSGTFAPTETYQVLVSILADQLK